MKLKKNKKPQMLAGRLLRNLAPRSATAFSAFKRVPTVPAMPALHRMFACRPTEAAPGA